MTPTEERNILDKMDSAGSGEDITNYKGCSFCEHYNKDNKCKAFPDGIPEEILSDDWCHVSPYYSQVDETLYKEKKLANDL